MPLQILYDNITKLDPVPDIIVNAANPQLQMGSGVCGAIFKAAGATSLQEACDERADDLPIGDTFITDGFNLCKYIFHTVGVVYGTANGNEKALLENCYGSALRAFRYKMQTEGVRSIAFPLISAGIYGYPKEEVLHIAVTAILDYLQDNDVDIDVKLVLWNG